MPPSRQTTRTAADATVGVVEHGNSAVLVTLGPDHALLDRRRIDLTAPGTPTHPHHHEGSWAVGRYLGTHGSRAITLAEAVALVEQVRNAAQLGARDALADLSAAVSVPIGSMALRVYPVLPPTTEARIRDPRAQTFADTAMYREVLAEVAAERGWSVLGYDRDQVLMQAQKTLGRTDLDAFLKQMGKAAGPPWQAIHRLAATAAIAARRR